MNYQAMEQEYLKEVERIDLRLSQLREQGRRRREVDLIERIGRLEEIRDDLKVTAHILGRRARGAA